MSVMSKLYAACVVPRLEKKKDPDNWKQLHVGSIDGISCQHFPVLMTNLLLQKHWEWQEDTRPLIKHGGDTSHKVLGKRGYQDGLRRGLTEAHWTNCGGAQCPRLGYCSSFT